MFTSLTVLPLSSSPARHNRALIACLDRSSRIMSAIRPSEGPNIRSVPAVPTHLDLHPGTPARSLPALAFPKLSPVQVKPKEIPISLQTLRQSQSLKRVRVKKESRSPSLHFTVGPHHRTCSPPRLHPPGRQPQPPPPPPGRSPSPPLPIMSSPASPPDKDTLKLLLLLRYDGKTVIECNHFISQLLIYWAVALSLLDGDTRTWATPIFSQLTAVQVKIPGATTPFADEVAFLTAFKARFGNLNDAAAAQVEFTKLCADKSLCKKRTTAEFSALIKGPADRSGYGDLELRDKYLSGIPSRVYRKIELETFTMWEDADKRATEVEQQLDISQARQPELNSFFSARGRGHGGSHGAAPHSQGASASINAAVGKGDFPGECFGCGKQGY
ncbi:hypothetical protein IEO21_10185 [Rhodonia placenta]|uniref:Retrotransposon gag domain-containing protein n=1 Tax=Rhodonia placenta TaxID=104341 RepID=A0A8H7NSX3_9APHY|nr:hypothetical protein IEO21_10185 [Postia placenta]